MAPGVNTNFNIQVEAQIHCDGIYASQTVQIALYAESEYCGGKLCFFFRENLSTLEHPLGSMTRHEARVLHAVTSVRSGVRKSMFILDQNNGLGESRDAVIEVEESDIRTFLRTKESHSEIGNCILCSENKSSVVMVPCGHLCLCSGCVDRVSDQCPKCERVFSSKTVVQL